MTINVFSKEYFEGIIKGINMSQHLLLLCNDDDEKTEFMFQSNGMVFAMQKMITVWLKMNDCCENCGDPLTEEQIKIKNSSEEKGWFCAKCYHPTDCTKNVES